MTHRGQIRSKARIFQICTFAARWKPADVSSLWGLLEISQMGGAWFFFETLIEQCQATTTVTTRKTSAPWRCRSILSPLTAG